MRAKIVEDPKDYKWSSYHVYAYGKKDSVVDEHPIYRELSKDETERRKRYREFVKGMVKDKNAMKGEMDRRVVYGSKDFIEEIAKEYEIEEIIKPKGRPKKGVEEGK